MGMVASVAVIPFLFRGGKSLTNPKTNSALFNVNSSMCVCKAIVIATESEDAQKLFLFCFCNFQQPAVWLRITVGFSVKQLQQPAVWLRIRVEREG